MRSFCFLHFLYFSEVFYGLSHRNHIQGGMAARLDVVYRRASHLPRHQEGYGAGSAPSHGLRGDSRQHSRLRAHRRGRDPLVLVQGGYRGERSHAPSALYRHRGDDRFRTSPHQSEVVYFGRRGAAWHFRHAHSFRRHRLSLKRLGVHRHHRRGGRPHLHSRRAEIRLAIFRAHHGGRILLHGACAHRAACGRQTVHDQKGTPHQNALQRQTGDALRASSSPSSWRWWRDSSRPRPSPSSEC